MNYRDKLKAKAAGLIARLKEIGELELDRELTADEAKEFDDKTAELKGVKSKLDQLDEIEAAEEAVNRSVGRPVADETGNIAAVTCNPGTVPAEPKEKLTDAQTIGVCAWATARNKHYPAESPLAALDKFGFGEIAKACERTRNLIVENKAFESIGAGGGANTIFTPLSSEFIDFLRNETVIMRGSPLMVDLTNGALDITGGNVGVAGTYHAEGADLTYVQATTRKINLSAKHLGAITAISNYNIEISPLPIAQILGEDLLQGVTVSMDSAGLRGDGTGQNPTGLLSLTNAANKFAATGAAAPTIAQADTACRTAQLKLAAANIPKRRLRWIMCNRVHMYLKYLRDGNGNKAYPSLSESNPTWDGIPVLLSEQVPSNLGVGTNESEIYLVDFGHFLLGVARMLALKSSTEASYYDGVGTRSAFQRDQTVIRAMSSHDFELRYDKAASVVTAVQWGA